MGGIIAGAIFMVVVIGGLTALLIDALHDARRRELRQAKATLAAVKRIISMHRDVYPEVCTLVSQEIDSHELKGLS